MVTVLVTSILLFAVISYAIHRWQRSSSSENAERFFPPSHAGLLFGRLSRTEEDALLAAETEARGKALRADLLARSAQGDKAALVEASAAHDAELYNLVLDALIERAETDAGLLSLVSHIARDERLHVSPNLAAKFTESCRRAPDRSTTAKMLHVAALSGDANTYRQAVDTAAEFWRDQSAPSLNADELRQLVESEYWLLPAASRNSGAGFVLKRTLAQLRRELTTSTNNRQASIERDEV
jgi:hypothetical protein